VGNGSNGIPPTLNERAKPPPQKSELNRAVDRTRNLYEKNGWTFLPLGGAGEHSSGVPTLQGEQQPNSGGINKPELHPPKELPFTFEPNLPNQEDQRSNLSAADQVILTKFREASELWGKCNGPQ
jgi:hypothetical protein